MDPRLQYGQSALPHPASQSIHPSQLQPGLGQVLGNNYMYPATSAYTALSNGTTAQSGYPSSALSSTQMYPHQISSQAQTQAPQPQAQ
ncbi:hypothetical protein BGZ74_005211, partial [Mortierella antarctica]